MSTTTIFKNKKSFGVEKEATQNTAETIVAADCFRALDPKIDVKRNPIDDESIRTTFGKTKPIPGGKSCDVSFGWYLKGSGTAGTAPASPKSDALQAVGFAETDGTIVVDYNLSDTSSSITAQIIEGVAAGSVGKSKIAKGIKGNAVINLDPGGPAKIMIDGQGGLSSDADATVLAASGEDSGDPPVLVSASMTLAEIHPESIWDTDGAVEKIADGETSNLKLSMGWTQSGAKTIVGYLVNIQKNGTPATETNGMQIRIETDSTGDPSGTPVSNTTVTKATTLIEDNHSSWYLYLLARGSRGAVADSTPYHAVVSGDWNPDTDKCIKISTKAVLAPAQKCQYYDEAWAALALKNLSLVVLTAPAGGDDLYFGPTEINLNNEVSLTPDDPNDGQGYPEADINGADPTITISPRDTLDSQFDLAELFDDQDELFYHCQVGSTSGNIIEIDGFRCVVVDVTDEDRDNKMVRSLPLRIDRELTGAGLRLRHR